MKIAIPTAKGLLCAHFGHCEKFAFVDINVDTGEVASTELLTPPPHEPGVLPRWVAEQKAEVVLAGGMGRHAQDLFNQNGVKVQVGSPAGTPEDLAKAFVKGELMFGVNSCDH